ncbi:MAG: hypothetical protein ACLTTU_13555 [Bilophila wadsworthia]
MDGNLSLILAFLVSISVVLALVIKFKLPVPLAVHRLPADGRMLRP